MTKTHIMIGDRPVGEGHPPYLIAEACINHEGRLDLARDMAVMAKAMGADAVKYQFHVLDDEMLRGAPQSDNFDEPLWDALDRTNLPVEAHKELKAFCKEIGIDYMCTPFSRASADILHEEIGVGVFKVGSGELTNLPLQKHIAAKGKPMIVSTGMSEIREIARTVETLKEAGASFALTHCVSIYPCPAERLNIGMIPIYRETFGVPVGLSDHCPSIWGALGAVGLGACILEKHITFDRSLPGPDHASSIEPRELGLLSQGARAIFDAGGSERVIFEEEQQIAAWARESVVSIAPIAKGCALSAANISVKRPGPAGNIIPAAEMEAIFGRTAAADIPADKQIRWTDLT